MQHGSSIIEINRRQAIQSPNVHNCALCGKSTSIARPVCPVCAKGLD